ncbi:hypothetical protein CHLNCDRAFT_144442 [Chlorella variabilis]|uniref:Coiled-coil domain-containing protein 39 n=1 Tax=Chlorella variabilis TaxID=554065 RepID=E1ZBG3_CHLVA|nr:hypothetical protein CHLNCDRAFT_144442 [Chlorella variabilis]EFN56849.1 hypothetical protein CHLNCDRAFT_144442 [Chlorella variabilis]|eukprot:XP_005848951.1 hypothetical protein CHLNCDRAFT_144442 [Chlorella variabilis]
MEIDSYATELTPPPLAAADQRTKRGFLPEFADDRNRALDHDIRALETELEGAQIQVDENKEHTRVLAEHLDNVRLEISHTQARLAARRREVETEAHLQEVAARETGRLRADIARLQQRRGELEQSATAMQTEAFQAGERMDQFKLVQNWNQARGARIPAEELEQWLAAATQKEEDNLALERYRRQDEARVKELGMQLEQAAREAHQTQRDLDDEITETQAAQTELSKAAQDFRRLHAERQELLQQWEGVLEAIRKRDASILEAGQQHAERTAQLATLKQELAVQAAELDAELAAGAAAQKRILAQERSIKGLYGAFASSQAAVAEAEDKADLLSNSLGRAADEAQRQAAASGHLRAELERRAAAVEAAQGRLDAARVRVALEGHQLGSLQQKIQELEKLRAEEQQRASSLDKEIAALGKRQFGAGQALHAAQERERRLASESSGARAQGRNLSHKMAQLEEQLVRQQEVRYNADYQLVEMERRVARAEGHRSRDETAVLGGRIKELEGTLAAAQAAHGMLVEEVKRAQDDYARAQRHSQAVQRERGAILDDMSRLALESGAAGRAAKAAAREREERLVEVDMGRLESGEVMSLETRKRSLEAGMRERRSEGEARLLRDEVHRVALELQARQLALQKLRRKHETLVLKGRCQDGEEAHSQAYFIIKAAQERQELAEQARRRGAPFRHCGRASCSMRPCHLSCTTAEALKAQIAQAERECGALEATLRRLVGTNSDMHYHARHNGVQELLDEQEALRHQLDRAAAALKLKLAAEGSRAEELEQAQARLANVAAEEAGLRQRVEALEKQKAEAEQQLRDQRQRRQRAAQRAAKLQGQAVAAARAAGGGPPAGMPAEALVADVQLAQVKAATRGMLEALGAAAAEHPDLNLLARVEAEAGVKVAGEPSRPGSASARSLCSAVSSARSPGGSRPGSAPRAEGGSRLAAAAAGTAARSPGGSGSRPGSSCAGSLRSAASARGSPAKAPAVQTIQLSL